MEDGNSSGEEARNADLAYAESIVETVREPLLVLDGGLRVKSANRAFYRTFRVSAGETQGRLLYDLGNGQWDIPRLRTLLEELLPRNASFEDYEVEHDFPGIGPKVMVLNARKLRRAGTELILLAIEDVTERRRAEEERRAIETRFTALVKNVKDHAIFTLDAEGRVTSWNIAAEHVLGYSEAQALGRHFAFIFTPEDRAQGQPEAELRTARTQGRAEDERWHLRRGGERFWALGIVTALHDAEGRLTGFSKILRDMTARKRAEEALQASAERLRRMLDIKGVGVLIFDDAGTLIDANDAFLRMTGRDRAQVESRALHWRVLTPPEHVAESERQLRVLGETGRIGPYEKQYYRKDGSRSWLLFAGASLGDGTVIEYCVDIDDRRRAEEALRQSEERFRLAVEGSKVALYECDLDLRYTWIANPIEGFAAEQILGKTDAELLAADDARALCDFKRRALAAAAPIEEELRGRPRGQDRCFLMRAERLSGPGGDVRGLRVLALDITAAKRTETALRESEARFRALTTATSDWIYRMSPDWRRMWYLRGRDWVAATQAPDDHWLEAYVPADEQAHVRAAIDAAIRDKRPFELEHRVRREDGSPGWRFSRAVPLLDEHGEIVEWFGAAGDVTSRKEAELALAAANARLREADRRKTEFLGVLSHELRNPLAPIKNSLYILERVGADSAQAQHARTVLARQVDQLVRLVDDLLDVTRITRGKIRLRRERLELGELVRRTVEDHRPVFEKLDVALALQPAPAPLCVFADANRLAQALGNLLQNALKFTPPGGRVSVALGEHGAAEAGERRASVRVADSGVGMAPAVLDRLFEPFMQADETLDRSRGGLGLGLALVKGLLELHGGEVAAQSPGPGQGSVFTLFVPLATGAAACVPEERPPEPLVRRRVLVIEDNADAAESLRQLLALEGQDVRVAADGPAGLAAARDFRPQLVLCDIGLPGMSGYEVARALRADPALAPVVLVALSGYARPEDLQQAAAVGFDHHLAKPANLARIAEILRAGGP